MFTKAGVNFYMYKTANFVEYAKEHFKSPIDQDSIDEVRDIEQSDEKFIGPLGKAANELMKRLRDDEKNLTLLQSTATLSPILKKVLEEQQSLVYRLQKDDLDKLSKFLKNRNDNISDFQSNDSDEQSDKEMD